MLINHSIDERLPDGNEKPGEGFVRWLCVPDLQRIAGANLDRYTVFAFIIFNVSM